MRASREHRPLRYGLLLVLAAALALPFGCISSESPVLDAAEGCDEFVPGESLPATLVLEPEVERFVQASADLGAAAAEVRAGAFTACANIARDLGADDTWSALADSEEATSTTGGGADALSNDAGTGACDAAAQRMEDVLAGAGEVEAQVALLVSKGECHFDFGAQVECDAECSLGEQCTAGTVETRCEPGDLSVVCDAACEADAFCVGRPEQPANCMGQCESTCQGECRGSCMAPDGSITENDPNCNGKCAASCNGTCRGMCKIDAPEGIECGGSVRCSGGCSGSYSDPVCVSEFSPPQCEFDAACHAACSARVESMAECDPTLVEVFIDVEDDPDLAPLVATLQQNLPPLIAAAEDRGPTIAQALEELGEASSFVGDNVEDLQGKSLACLAVASSSLGETLGGLSVSLEASAHVKVTLEDHSL